MAQDAKPTPSNDDAEFVRELSWKMLDGCIEEEEAEQLDLLLMHSEQARAAYVETVQLHVDLLDKFGGLPRSQDIIKKLLDEKLAESKKSANVPAAGEIPKTEPTGA